jgi:hypothetical protein
MKQLFAAVLIFSGLAFGQQPKVLKEKPLPISHYMQEVGLHYLDYVDKMYDQAVQDQIVFDRDPLNNESVRPNDNAYGMALTDLENHIEINIKSGGDKRFLALLENTRAYAQIAYFEEQRTTDPKYKNIFPPSPEIAKMYPVCFMQAHLIIRTAEFNQGDCSIEKADKATKADKTLKEKQNEAKP